MKTECTLLILFYKISIMPNPNVGKIKQSIMSGELLIKVWIQSYIFENTCNSEYNSLLD